MLSEQDYIKAAAKLGVEVAAIKAVAKVEARGDGFLGDHRPKVLFERHVMFRRARSRFGDLQARHWASKYPDLINATPGGYSSYYGEHERLGRAASKMDRDCALESASWGAFQIMGYHWERLGYASLQQFINAMYRSEADHLDAFCRFILADATLLKALRTLNWPRFAYGYNGKNYRKNNYAKKMRSEYRAARRAVHGDA